MIFLNNNRKIKVTNKKLTKLTIEITEDRRASPTNGHATQEKS